MAIIAGRTPSLQSRGYSGWLKPTLWRVSLERVPTNWRAGCGRSACPVRREGESHGFLPTPIGTSEATAEVASGCRIGNAVDAESVEEVLIIAAKFDVL